MVSAPLDLLFVSSFPASPPTFGAQRRLEGLMRSLAARHSVSFVGLLPPGIDAEVTRRAMSEYCTSIELIPWPQAHGPARRLAQLRSLASWQSHERRSMNSRALQTSLDRLLRSRRFDAISIEMPYFAFANLRQSPAGTRPPRVIIDSHNVESDLARQYGIYASSFVRRLHHAVNWRKIRREEVRAWGLVDGVAFTSPDDEARARALLPTIHSAVVPNGVDTDQFYPRPQSPGSDAKTLLFFGTMNYYPNLDAVRWLLREIWPLIAARVPDVRLQIIGSHPPPDVLAHAGPRVEIAGLVEDLQASLAKAAAVIVPLRIGGGTRLKILESLSMGKAIVSTTLGAEGIGARSGRELLLADEPAALAKEACRLLENRELAGELGNAGRALAERSYSWRAIGMEMERFLRGIVDGPSEDGGAVAPRASRGAA